VPVTPRISPRKNRQLFFIRETRTMSEQNTVTATVPEADESAVREAALKEATKLLSNMAKAYAKGERGLLTSTVEAGEYAAQYVAARLAMGDKRAAAVQAVEGKLAEVGGEIVKANVLISTYHAHRLLSSGDNCPFTLSHFREAFVLLVTRTDKDTPQEQWTLLPGFEEECKALYSEAASAKLSKTACIDKCRALVKKYEAELAKAEACNAQTAADKAASAVTQAATPEAKAELQRTADALKAVANKATEKAADKELLANAPLAPKAPRSTPAPAPVVQPRQPLPTCIGTAKSAASAKDLGQLLADMVKQSGKDMSEVIEHFAACMDWNPKIGMALVKGMVRSESPSTVNALRMALNAQYNAANPSKNGQLVAAA
jgi:hypothetical protein